MKITRDDIKEMINETLSIIMEGRKPYDDLTGFFNDNIEKIKLGQLKYNDLPSNYFGNEKNFNAQLNKFRVANQIPTYNKILKAQKKQNEFSWDKFFSEYGPDVDFQYARDNGLFGNQNVTIRSFTTNKNKYLKSIGQYDEKNQKQTLNLDGDWANFFKSFLAHTNDKKEQVEILQQLSFTQDEVQQRLLVFGLNQGKNPYSAFKTAKTRYFNTLPGLRETEEQINQDRINNLLQILKEKFNLIEKNIFKGVSLTKSDNLYQAKLAIALFYMVKRSNYGFRLTDEFKPYNIKKMPYENTPFYDFVQGYLFYISNKRNFKNYDYNLQDACLCYFISLLFDIDINYDENLQNRYDNEVVPLIPVTPTKTKDECVIYLQQIGFDRYNESVTEQGINDMLTLLMSNGEQQAYISLCNLIEKLKSISVRNRVLGPQRILTLGDVFHMFVYLIGFRSFYLVNIVDVVKKRYNNLMYRNIISYGFKFMIASFYQYGEFFNFMNKLNQAMNGNVNTLFDYTNKINENKLLDILYAYGSELDITQQFYNINIPFCDLLECSDNISKWLTTCNPYNFGGEECFNYKNIINSKYYVQNVLLNMEKQGANVPEMFDGLDDISNNGKTSQKTTFYRFLKNNIASKDKTQMEIFLFLNKNSKFPWIYEYNRYRKDGGHKDVELGAQSIDMLCETPNKIYAVEYQGELHFRPFNVKPQDSKLFYADKIIESLEKSIEYYKQEFQYNEAKIKSVIQNDIINILTKFANTYYTQDKKYGELKKWLEENKNTNYFNSAETSFFPEYLLHPKRFLNEITILFNKERDVKKSNIIRNRNWILIYILPGSTTVDAEDVSKSKENADYVFRWNKKADEGVPKIIEFLEMNGLKNINSEENESDYAELNENSNLFTQIVNEVLYK